MPSTNYRALKETSITNLLKIGGAREHMNHVSYYVWQGEDQEQVGEIGCSRTKISQSNTNYGAMAMI